MTKREAEAARARCQGSLIRLNRDDCLNALDMLERAMEIVKATAQWCCLDMEEPLTCSRCEARKLLFEWEAKDEIGKPPLKTS